MCAPGLNNSGAPTAPLRHRTLKTRMCAPGLNVADRKSSAHSYLNQDVRYCTDFRIVESRLEKLMLKITGLERKLFFGN
jgi:hypothetical protein